jgi:hypothetical protein
MLYGGLAPRAFARHMSDKSAIGSAPLRERFTHFSCVLGGTLNSFFVWCRIAERVASARHGSVD